MRVKFALYSLLGSLLLTSCSAVPSRHFRALPHQGIQGVLMDHGCVDRACRTAKAHVARVLEGSNGVNFRYTEVHVVGGLVDDLLAIPIGSHIEIRAAVGGQITADHIENHDDPPSSWMSGLIKYQKGSQ